MNGILHNSTAYARQIIAGAKELKHTNLSKFRKVFSLMGKNEKIVLAVLILLAGLSLFWSVRNFYISHTKPAAGFGGSFSEALLGQPTYINPLLAHNEADLSLSRLIFSSLYKFNNDGSLIPDLADGMPQISEDQKQYTITLKQNVKWHNDKPLTADDVVYTFQTLKDQNFKSPFRSMWQSTSIEKLSDFKVKFSTKDISGPFMFNLTQGILPKNVWEKTEAQNFLLSKTNLEAIGSGPYAIKEIKKLTSGKIQSITLKAFTAYYGGKPHIEQIVFKFYDSEEDILNALHSREISAYGFLPLGSNLYLDKEQKNLKIYNLPLPQYQAAFFNLSKKTLSEEAVRKALNLASNKQQIIDQIFKGDALLPSSPLLNNPQTNLVVSNISYNLDQAKELLEKAGWKIDSATSIRTKKNLPLEITISTNDSSVNAKTAELLAENWKQLNIKVSLNILPTKQLTDTVIRPRNFDVLVFPQKFGPDPDPFIFWHSSQIKDPGLNLTNFNSPDADKLITSARSTTNAEIRVQKYLELDKLISGTTPVIYLNQMVYLYAVDSQIKNIGLKQLFESSQRFFDTGNWYINTARIWK
jgi:peptide/nickel transport system substrate-binding protein